MSKSSIEWTEDTWNPIVGCSILSPGCANCYAMSMAARIEAMNAAVIDYSRIAKQYNGTTKRVNGHAVWTGKLALASDKILLQPLKRKKPTTYFVNSMGDLFHEDCPDEWIDKVFAVMALSPQHTFQVLTKRAKRMRQWFAADRAGSVGLAMLTIVDRIPHGHRRVPWPLANVWLGVSTERQQEADERIPELLNTPAAIRFISAEPLLGPINLDRIHEWFETPEGARVDMWESALNGKRYDMWAGDDEDPMQPGHPKLDWVIVGGESGPSSRPMHPDWARSLRDQCSAAGAPFFFKQWGNWHPEIDRDRDDPYWRQPYSDYREPNFQILNLAGGRGFHGERVHVMRLCSKKSAGRLLDGMIHDEYPGGAP